MAQQAWCFDAASRMAQCNVPPPFELPKLPLVLGNPEYQLMKSSYYIYAIVSSVVVCSLALFVYVYKVHYRGNPSICTLISQWYYSMKKPSNILPRQNTYQFRETRMKDQTNVEEYHYESIKI